MYTLHSSVYSESLFWRFFLMNYLYLSKNIKWVSEKKVLDILIISFQIGSKPRSKTSLYCIVLTTLWFNAKIYSRIKRNQ